MEEVIPQTTTGKRYRYGDDANIWETQPKKMKVDVVLSEVGWSAKQREAFPILLFASQDCPPATRKLMTNGDKHELPFSSGSVTVDWLDEKELMDGMIFFQFLLLFDWVLMVKSWGNWEAESMVWGMTMEVGDEQFQLNLAARCNFTHRCLNRCMHGCRGFSLFRWILEVLPDGERGVSGSSESGFLALPARWPLGKVRWLHAFLSQTEDAEVSGKAVACFLSLAGGYKFNLHETGYSFLPRKSFTRFSKLNPYKMNELGEIYHRTSRLALPYLSPSYLRRNKRLFLSFALVFSLLNLYSFLLVHNMFDPSMPIGFGDSNSIEGAILCVDDLVQESPTPPISLTLVLKIVGPVDVTSSQLAKYLHSRWSLRGGAEFIKIPKTKNVFTVEFFNPEDYDRVQVYGPFHYRLRAILISKFNALHAPIHHYPFQTVVWVQADGLPRTLRHFAVARRIANFIGRFVAYDSSEETQNQGILRFKARINGAAALPRGVTLLTRFQRFVPTFRGGSDVKPLQLSSSSGRSTEVESSDHRNFQAGTAHKQTRQGI